MKLKDILGQIYLEYLPNNLRLERIWKLAQVDFKKRYYNDKLGLLWALVNPLTQIAIYYFVFTRIFQRGGSIPNFSMYLFSGLIMWIGFSQATNMGMRILLVKKYLIENIQFNWLDLHLTHMISISFGLLFNLFAYGVGLILLSASIGEYWYLFPVVFVTWFLLSYSVTILLSVIRPVFDDIAHIWGIVLLIGFWVSGIFFDGDLLIKDYPILGVINPFIGLILNTRACILEQNNLFPQLLIQNLLYGIFLTIIASIVFKKYAKLTIEKL